MNRNYGIDLVKILAMFGVLVHHLIFTGGLLENTTGIKYFILLFINLVAFCAVNIFVLTTGYLYADKKRNFKNIIKLWLEVLFYSIVITIILYCFNYKITKMEILRTFFPVLRTSYWFFTEYVALFCFIPILNRIVNNKIFLLKAIILFITIFYY